MHIKVVCFQRLLVGEYLCTIRGSTVASRDSIHKHLAADVDETEHTYTHMTVIPPLCWHYAYD
jgi:tartrate dehydratase beta subunit/fumarate hydratase class I family protein